MSDTIEITRKNAAKAFQDADNKGKKLLRDLLGEKNIYENIMERVQSYQDACEVHGCEPVQIKVTGGGLDDGDIDSLNAIAELFLIYKVMNEGKKPTWGNSTPPKHYPYFDLSSGVGLSFGGCGDGSSVSSVGSRLCIVNDSKKATYIGKQFTSIFKRLMTF